MSYEGYSICFCKNGHRVGIVGVYEAAIDICPVCDSTQIFTEEVDLTNGCSCNDNSCCSHEKKRNITGYTEKPCEVCDSKGYIKVPVHSQEFQCSKCLPHVPVETCGECYGTGKVWKLLERTEAVVCPSCKGRGTTFIPMFEISDLINKNIEEKDIHEQTLMVSCVCGKFDVSLKKDEEAICPFCKRKYKAEEELDLNYWCHATELVAKEITEKQS